MKTVYTSWRDSSTEFTTRSSLAMTHCPYPGSPGSLMQDSLCSPNQKRLSSETWSTISGLPLLEQQRKEPWLFPIMRWIFILLALALLGFVLFVFGHLVHDYAVDARDKEGRVATNKTKI